MLTSFFNKFKKDSANKPPQDPVCGMRASENITLVYQGQIYSFCSDHCKQQFEKDPKTYATK